MRKTAPVFALFVLFYCGCAARTPVEPNRPHMQEIPETITRKVPRWNYAGTVSQKAPNALRVLKRYTGRMGSAMGIVQENYYKYSKAFHKTLSYGTTVYISRDEELYIDPAGGPAPDEYIIEHEPNPAYFATQGQDKGGSAEKPKPLGYGEIVEEDLSE